MHSYRRDVPRQFAKKPLAERLAEDLEGALQEADSRHVDDWSIESLEQHADEIVAAEALQPLEVRPAKKVVDDEQFLNPRERGGGVTELIAVKIPHNHHQGYFLFVPSNPPSKPLHADVDKKYVIFRYFAS